MARLSHIFAGMGATMAMMMALPASAQNTPLSVRDSFRIGTSGTLCTAQNSPADTSLTSIYDRGYALVCRDAASAIGKLYALRNETANPADRLVAQRPTSFSCDAGEAVTIEGVGTAMQTLCRDTDIGIAYKTYVFAKGRTTYVATGLSGYDSALKLGLASLVADKIVAGEVQVATTSADDPAAFARVQAGALDAEGARNEAYLRNNRGNFAEASEFFEILLQRQGGDQTRNAEFLANQALQESNLGNFAAADALFARAVTALPARDAVIQRMVRNFRAIHELNQRDSTAAIKALDTPVVGISRSYDDDEINAGFISPRLSDQINRENDGLRRLGGIDAGLTAFERAEILDGQSESLRGTALRTLAQYDAAEKSLKSGERRLAKVRDGRVTSTAWLRADIATELALVAEAQQDYGAARGFFNEAVNIWSVEYPASPALLAVKARLAAFLGRRGEDEAAIALYEEVADASETVPGAAAAVRDLISPYFALLAARADSDPAAAPAMFLRSQILQRPGVAQTQAVLARELSEGNSEASALFRLSVTRTREIARTTTEISRLSAKPKLMAEEELALAAAKDALVGLEREQIALQSKLGEFARYRVLSPRNLTMAEMQDVLREGEAYFRLITAGGQMYGIFVSKSDAEIYALPKNLAAIEKDVADLRDSIVRDEFGVPTTYPFDVKLAREMYLTLFGPVADRMGNVTNLIFEPDGPLLQLPPGLLVTEQKGVDDYLERIKSPDADEFDFSGVAWLARGRNVTIAVSPRSFVDVRSIAPAQGSKTYLGLGQNASVSQRPAVMMAAAQADGDACLWPIRTWQNPIKPDELLLAQSIVGKGNSTVLTGAAFNDAALESQQDLSDYRIIHFATHGLVTAPRPECPARPALVTSFGAGQSDGLLTFKEIFDLKLDADVVILSACDTAGMATVGASREAGVSTGGNYALDGLVRAFIGAGARSVVASHWPVPDDFDATKKLISALFESAPGTPLATSLGKGQTGLMDDPLTSHPYYWAAFVVLGDGQKPLLRGN